MDRGAAGTFFFIWFVLTAGFLFGGRTAAAGGVSGAAELARTTSDTNSTDASGLSSNTRADAFLQRYSLFYTETLFPYLSLRAGGYFDKTISEANGPAGEIRSTDTNVFPSAALTLNNPFVSAGAGVSRREGKFEVTGEPAVTNIQDSENAFLGFRPEGLPFLDMQAARSHTFDRAHETTDSENESFSVSLRYTPVQNLDLASTVTLFDSKDRLTGTESGTMTQSGRAGYSNRYFDDRVVFSTDFSGVRSETETRSGSGGEVAFQLFPFAGLSGISDTPTLDALGANQALVDGATAASSGINIGQGPSFGGDTRLRSVGLDFVNATGVNTLYIYTDRQLPAAVTSSLSWDIYVSSDNQNWTLFQTGLHGAFNPFTNRFELLFPEVTTRYIKASTRPLAVTVLPTPGTDISNVFITELQSFIRTSAEQAAGVNRSTSRLFDASLSTALLENQLLVYSIFFSQAKSSGASAVSFLSNALSSAKQFNRVFSGTARVARDDNREPLGNSTAYSGTASLIAVPLPTLNHSLVLSVVRREEANDQTSNTQSVFLNNTAALYQGIDVNLSGGVSFSSVPTGGTSESTIINAGAGIVPNESLSMSMNRSESESRLPDGTINHAVSTTGGAAWAPCATVYLAYTISTVSATNVQSQTTQNYSTSWSPFSSGALSFTALYGETLRSPEATIDRALSFGAEWRVGPRIFFNAGYTIAKSRTPSQSADARILSTDLRMTF